jgi:hypothetical protein
MTGWLRSRAYDLWIGLKPSRFGLLTVLLLILGFMEPWTGRAFELCGFCLLRK